MGIIKSVLKEELNNAYIVKEDYEKALKEYCGGSYVKKKIKGNEYYYHAYRHGKKVVFKYKGKKLSKEDKDKLQKSKKKRKKYKEMIGKVNKRIKYLRRVLRGKEDV